MRSFHRKEAEDDCGGVRRGEAKKQINKQEKKKLNSSKVQGEELVPKRGLEPPRP
jgi:hypothetical protein